METLKNEEQGKTKKCFKCKEDILQGAKKCKHCGADLRSWFIRHKIITGLLVLMLIGVVLPKNLTSSGTSSSSSTTSTASAKKYTKEKCNSVSINMSKSQVTNILGEPTSTSESQTAGLGKTEWLQFQEPFVFEGCSIYLSNNKVNSVSWVDL